MNLSLSLMITIIVALCSVVCPIITTYEINKHDTKVRKMEFEQKLKEEHYFHFRGIYETYLKNAGRVMTLPEDAPFSDYGESYLLALTHSPKNIQSKMIEADRLLQKHDWEAARPLLESLTDELRNILQESYI